MSKSITDDRQDSLDLRVPQRYTTGQIARICRVAPRTVTKWIDSGALPGYVVPGTGHRRVSRPNLLAFLARHNIDWSVTDDNDLYRVLVVGPPQWADAIRDRLADSGDFWVATAASAPEAGYRMATTCPTCVVVDGGLGRINAHEVADVATMALDGKRLAMILVGDADIAWPSRYHVVATIADRGEFLRLIRAQIANTRRLSRGQP